MSALGKADMHSIGWTGNQRWSAKSLILRGWWKPDFSPSWRRAAGESRPPVRRGM